MKAVEFESQMGPDNTLVVPPAAAAQVPTGKPVRVLLLFGESSEDGDWQRLTSTQFLKGYAASDALYDELPDG